MNGSIYIYGDPEGPPFKLGSTTNARIRFWQHRTNPDTLKTIKLLGLTIDLAACRYLHLWDAGTPGQPLGIEGELLESLKEYRLSFQGKGKNGTTRPYMTEWINLPIANLCERVRSIPWMQGRAEVNPFTVIPDPAYANHWLHVRRNNSDLRGRPPTGISNPTGLRLYPELEAKLDDWRVKQADKPGRPEAIRRLIEKGLRK